jgi:hypothetical protein
MMQIVVAGDILTLLTTYIQELRRTHEANISLGWEDM